MEISARDDIEAPIEFVFDQLCDFATFERSIMRRGADIERTDGGKETNVGTKWRVKFRLRGRERTVRAEITQADKPNSLKVAATSVSADGSMMVELVALSRSRTRMIVTCLADAKTIPAKLMFQSLKFARARTDAKFNALVAGFAKDVAEKFRA